MSETKKDLWCPKCKTYPDEVNDVYDWAVEHRRWNGSVYELDDMDTRDSHEECGICQTTLEYRPQDEEAEALPEVQPTSTGEVSSDEDISNLENEGDSEF